MGFALRTKLYGSLFQTVFLDIVVYWHTVDLFEHFLQVRNRDPVFFCQLRKGDIPLPVCQKVIPEMVCSSVCSVEQYKSVPSSCGMRLSSINSSTTLSRRNRRSM